MQIPSSILQLVLNNKSFCGPEKIVLKLFTCAAPDGGFCNIPSECICFEGYRGDNCLIGTSYLFSHVRLAMYIDAAILMQTCTLTLSIYADADAASQAVVGGVVGGVIVLLVLAIIILTVVILYSRQRNSTDTYGMPGMSSSTSDVCIFYKST